MVSIATMEVIAGIAVVIVLSIIPAIIARRVQHGEARFDKDGKLIKDE
ncbi:hypothetical protein [Parafrankia sp. BMG5.11]|nr:hypothetical protein [Parafrankia sp. BMG5.11]